MNYRGNNNEACLPERPKFRQNYGFQDMLLCSIYGELNEKKSSTP